MSRARLYLRASQTTTGTSPESPLHSLRNPDLARLSGGLRSSSIQRTLPRMACRVPESRAAIWSRRSRPAATGEPPPQSSRSPFQPLLVSRRWNPPNHVRALPSTEIDAILSGAQRGPDASTNAPPPAWTKYRADLVEGLLIAQDQDRLREWAKTKTGVELWLEQERERKRQTRIW